MKIGKQERKEKVDLVAGRVKTEFLIKNIYLYNV